MIPFPQGGCEIANINQGPFKTFIALFKEIRPLGDSGGATVPMPSSKQGPFILLLNQSPIPWGGVQGRVWSSLGPGFGQLGARHIEKVHVNRLQPLKHAELWLKREKQHTWRCQVGIPDGS